MKRDRSHKRKRLSEFGFITFLLVLLGPMNSPPVRTWLGDLGSVLSGPMGDFYGWSFQRETELAAFAIKSGRFGKSVLSGFAAIVGWLFRPILGLLGLLWRAILILGGRLGRPILVLLRLLLRPIINLGHWLGDLALVLLKPLMAVLKIILAIVCWIGEFLLILFRPLIALGGLLVGPVLVLWKLLLKILIPIFEYLLRLILAAFKFLSVLAGRLLHFIFGLLSSLISFLGWLFHPVFILLAVLALILYLILLRPLFWLLCLIFGILKFVLKAMVFLFGWSLRIVLILFAILVFTPLVILVVWLRDLVCVLFRPLTWLFGLIVIVFKPLIAFVGWALRLMLAALRALISSRWLRQHKIVFVSLASLVAISAASVVWFSPQISAFINRPPDKWENVNNLGQNARLLFVEVLVENKPIEGGVVPTGNLQEEFVYTRDFISGMIATAESNGVPAEAISWRITLLPARDELQHNRETPRIIGIKDGTLVLKRDNPKLFVPRLEDQYQVVEKYEFNPLRDEFIIGGLYSNAEHGIMFRPRPASFGGFYSSSLFLLDAKLYDQEMGAPVFVRQAGDRIWRYAGNVMGESEELGVIVQIAQKSLNDFQEVAYSTAPE